LDSALVWKTWKCPRSCQGKPGLEVALWQGGCRVAPPPNFGLSENHSVDKYTSKSAKFETENSIFFGKFRGRI